MTIFQALILGVVEGISEFLPISSTAHLIISAKILQIPNTDFLSSFLISIQLGAILSVITLYTRLIWQKPKIILKLASAFLPTAIIGLMAYKLVKNVLLDNLNTIAWALLLGGIILIILEKYFAKHHKNEDFKEIQDISHRQAALIGVFQSIAIIPGISRSAATIMGGLSLGISRKNIVEFSFLLALPTMAAATALDLYKNPPILETSTIYVWLLGLISAFIVAILGIRFFLKYIQRNDFQLFGWYRIVLGLAILLYLYF